MYIVIEGIDGSGKSTHAKKLADDLEAVHVVEPSSFEVGRLIRQRIGEGRLDAAVMARLFAADRHDLATRVTRPALEAGKIVVSDRNLLSSLVYQAEGDLTMGAIWDINMKGGPLPKPDLVVIIDVPVGEVTKRIRESRGHADAFETKERLRKHYDRYKRVGGFVDWPLIYIDGDAERSTVSERVRAAVDATLNR